MCAIFFLLLFFNKQSTMQEDQCFYLGKIYAVITNARPEIYDALKTTWYPLVNAASTVPPFGPS
jgi:hypothetical protein